MKLRVLRPFWLPYQPGQIVEIDPPPADTADMLKKRMIEPVVEEAEAAMMGPPERTATARVPRVRGAR